MVFISAPGEIDALPFYELRTRVITVTILDRAAGRLHNVLSLDD